MAIRIRAGSRRQSGRLIPENLSRLPTRANGRRKVSSPHCCMVSIWFVAQSAAALVANPTGGYRAVATANKIKNLFSVMRHMDGSGN